jgi:tetratricopeptide (TPR) repeat protein
VTPESQFAVLPDPGQASTLDQFAECLRLLKSWAGNPSYETVTGRVNARRPAGEPVGKTTVVDCFRSGRRRLDTELVVAIVAALHPDPGYVTRWRQALRVISGETRAAAQVRVQDALPADPPGFVGRSAELDRLRLSVRDAGDAVLISVLAGMAGGGKTRLAVHAGHLLAAAQPFDRVLFADLRGFHPDPAQPPADPAAVLDGFLRLLGVSGQNVPRGLEARSAAFRARLAGTRSLVVLDNAADERQAGPLLPATPGSVTLVTSRRSLRLPAAAHLAVDVFTPAEALQYLAAAVPGVPAGTDPDAAARIARRCGHLPLALALAAGHTRARPGWTLTDHADWLDERHDARRLDSGVHLALDVSYRDLPAAERRLLRLLALHPGPDLDAYAAAALAGTGPDATAGRLRSLCDVHLLQPAGPARYALHDLVRAYAAGRSADEDRRSDRTEALTRLFDYYLATAATAMNLLDPAETHRRPRVPPAATPSPELTSPVAWLDAERPNLVVVAAHAPTHATRLAAVLFRYLAGGYHADALAVHGAAIAAARDAGDPAGHARALSHLAVAEVQLGRHEAAAGHLEESLRLLRQVGTEADQARTLNNLGIAETRMGRYDDAAGHHHEALRAYRAAGDLPGQARALTNLGNLASRRGRDADAVAHYEQAIGLYRRSGDRMGESGALTNRAEVEARLGRHAEAEPHARESLAIARAHGHVTGEGWALVCLGTVHRGRGELDRAVEHHGQALAIFRRTGDRDGQAWSLNGLGEDARAAGDLAEAIARHTAALAIALEPDVADRQQQARAHTGLARAHHERGEAAEARQHAAQARTRWAELGSPEAERLKNI